MPAVLPDDLDEIEHQALDVLEDLDDTEPASVSEAEAVEIVGAAFDRLLVTQANRLLAAGQALALAEPERGLEPLVLERIRDQIAAAPGLAPALAPTLELLGLGLGLQRDRRAWAVAVERGNSAAGEAPDEFATVSARLAAVLRAAWPQSDSGPTPSPALRVFRLAALADAGPSVRARAIAAEHPEHLRLATLLVLAQPEASPSELLDAFDLARTKLETASDEVREPGSEAPKRRFTWVHALGAALILGLTLWHYLGR